MNRGSTIEDLDRRLTSVAAALAACTDLLRSVDLNAETNIRKIAEALANIYEIQAEIYQMRPDLTPAHIREGRERQGKD